MAKGTVTQGELHLLDYYRKMTGGFYTDLISAMLRADLANLSRFRTGFPDLYEAVRAVRFEPSYWPDLCERAGLDMETLEPVMKDMAAHGMAAIRIEPLPLIEFTEEVVRNIIERPGFAPVVHIDHVQLEEMYNCYPGKHIRFAPEQPSAEPNPILEELERQRRDATQQETGLTPEMEQQIRMDKDKN